MYRATKTSVQMAASVQEIMDTPLFFLMSLYWYHKFEPIMVEYRRSRNFKSGFDNIFRKGVRLATDQ
jgi:hypothetical protein